MLTRNYSRGFPGPRPFSRKDASHFYGRRREINDVFNLSAAYRDLLVYGGSGVGKSSVIGAGVVPELVNAGARVIQARIARTGRVHIPGPSAIHVLLQDDSRQAGDSISEATSVRNGGKERVIWPVGGDVGPSTLAALASEAAGTRTFLVFDQCEGLFFDDQYSSSEQRLRFFEALRSLFTEFSQFRSIFVVTEEYLSAMERFAEFVPNRFNIRYQIERLTRAGAFEAVEQGLREAGVLTQANVIEAIVDRLAVGGQLRGQAMSGAGIEPLQLQLVCGAILERVGPDHQLSFGAVEAFGGLDQVLGEFYDRLIAEATDTWRTSEADVRRWFEDDLITSESTRGLIHSRSVRARSVPESAVVSFTASHLIRSVELDQSLWYELTHDRMVIPIRVANRVWFERRSRRRRLLVASLVIAFLAIVLSALQLTVTRSRVLEGRKRPNAIIAEKASEALNKRRFQIAALWADYGIEVYGAEADRMEKDLERDHTPEPPIGAVADDIRVAILRRGVLNDAAFCYYVRGQASEGLGDRASAVRFYRAVRRYPYARSLDLHGWFWSPAKEAATRLNVLK